MKSLQLEKPHAMIITGIQGSGKSFFADKFADTFNAPYVEQALFEHASADAEAAEMLMQRTISELLKTKRSIVIELDLPTRNERLELSKTLRKAGYVPMVIWVQIDTETAMSRTYKSKRMSEQEYCTRMKRFTPPHQSESPLVISGKHTFATQAKAVLKKLSVPRPTTPTTERPPQSRGNIIVR